MKKIAVIQDLSGLGRCSLAAAIPVLSAMGVQACALPTSILSAQTGFSGSVQLDLTTEMEEFTNHWYSLSETFDGIYSGFLGNIAQVKHVEYFLDKFFTQDTFYLADPILGDHGKSFPFITTELFEGIRSLTRRATVITPNLTELCLLAEVDFEELTASAGEETYFQKIATVCDILFSHSHKLQTIVVTGILREKEDTTYMANLVVPRDGSFLIVEEKYTGVGFSGTGDLFASVLAGCVAKAIPLEEGARIALDFLLPPIKEATVAKTDRNYGVGFEAYLWKLGERVHGR